MVNGKRLSRRDFLNVCFGAAAAGGYAALPRRGLAAATGKAGRPNVILVLVDDLGYGDLGCYGQKHIRTPVLDRMAAEGLRLTRFHAGFPVCLPSRCTLMTGLHTGHCRCRVNGGGGNHPTLAEEDTTVAAVLRAAGYKTAMIGKWSLGDTYVGCVVKRQDVDGDGAIYKHGWDYYFGEPNQTYVHNYYLNQMYQYDRYGLVGKKTEGRRLDVVPYPGNAKSKKHYSHDLLTEKALAFIDAAKTGPFFLYLPYTVPHAKFEIPELEPYAEKADWSASDKVYASMITRMDRDLGKILARLKRHGLDDNTLVIFTSDNGSHRGVKPFNSNGGLPGGKGTFQLGGVRVPCVARWPGRVQPGRTSDELLAFWDFLPTFAELAGIRAPAPIDGLSFVPTLSGEGRQEHHKYLFFAGGRPGKGARKPGKQGSYLIVRGEGEGRSDEAVFAEAWSDVVVPKFDPKA